MSGPYEFGDVVDGYRWTVLGWEPVEGSEPAASAALQHALASRLERHAVTHHVHHARPPVPEPASEVDVAQPVFPAPAGAAATVPPAPAASASTDGLVAPEQVDRVWTPVGWELVPRTEMPTDADVAADAAADPHPDTVAAVSAAGPVDTAAEQAPSWPVEEFADVVAAAPSGPPVEAADVDPVAAAPVETSATEVDLGATPNAAAILDQTSYQVDLRPPDALEDVLDLREPALQRAITLPEPAAGWYPG